MKIARPQKVEIKLTVLIIISLFLLTACGAQPTVEPTPAPTATQIVQPTGTATATNMPAPSETPTPEAQMTVEQQLAYLESHGVPATINEKGEVVFDWLKATTDPKIMTVVHQETLAEDLAFWAEIFHNGFPEPDTTNPTDFSPVGWYSTVVEEKQFTRFAVNVLSDDYKDKPSPHQIKAAVFGEIDGQLLTFYFGRGLVTEPEEVVKNGGSHFVEFYVADDGTGWTQASSAKNYVNHINAIINGTYLLGMDNITGTLEELKTRPAPEWTSWQRANYYAWHLLHANLVGPDGKNILSVEDDALLQRLVDWKGFAAATQGKLFVGGTIPVTDIVPASVFVPTPIK